MHGRFRQVDTPTLPPGPDAFERSLEAYRAAFADGKAVIVLDRGDPFLQYLHSDK